jgi:hypothetical protein
MREAVPDSTLAVAALRSALEEMASALAEGSLDRLLACEARIESALEQLPMRDVAANARAAVRAEVEGARAALVRCRRLGLALDEFVTTGFAARSVDGGYGRTPQTTVVPLHSLNLTV